MISSCKGIELENFNVILAFWYPYQMVTAFASFWILYVIDTIGQLFKYVSATLGVAYEHSSQALTLLDEHMIVCYSYNISTGRGTYH